MKIRRYMGKDMQEAMLKVKMDLGSDAIILNTKKVKQKGLLNFFAKPLVEVLAAVDEGGVQSVSPVKARGKAADDMGFGAKAEVPVRQEGEKYASTKDIKGNLKEIEALRLAGREPNEALKINDLENKVNTIEDMLQKIYRNIINDKSQKEDHGSESKISGIIQVFEKNLLANNVEQAIVNEIVSKVKAVVTDQSGMNEVALKIKHAIMELLGKPQAIQLNETEKTKVIVFVGPTGVGKTTTLAKIAAIFSINHNRSLGIITSDTYRIAAVEQLKTYTEILGLPIQVIYSPEEVEGAIESFKDKDIVLIDTAGRSHKDRQQFEELKKIVEMSNPQEVYLLLSSTTDCRACKEIMDSYSFLKDYKIILTKMDEAAAVGIALNLKKHAGKDLSYMTVGQSVPDDIELIDVEKLAKKLMGSIKV